tara:strand:- start:157 stop:585 length:429 start_codon:yes stop_codon:yes gene_type:complete
MSQIISFSSDREFAKDLESLATNSGYNNRSRFIRDAVLYYSEIQQRGELMNMDEDLVIEGHLIVYYEHGSEQKLMVSRTDSVEVAAYYHSTRLGHSCHSCVDVIHVKGKVSDIRAVYEQLQNTNNVDKVTFETAPMRDDDCC